MSSWTGGAAHCSGVMVRSGCATAAAFLPFTVRTGLMYVSFRFFGAKAACMAYCRRRRMVAEGGGSWPFGFGCTPLT